MRFLILILASAALLYSSDTDERLKDSAVALREIMETKDRAIPQDLLDKADCAVIVPGLKKGAFVVGAKYGRGFMLCRRETAGWSAPAAIRMEGGSFGFQIGGSETDLIMLILNRSGAIKLTSSKFTLGADASVAAGPVGRTSTAETDAFMRAEILSWSRSRGVFAGISLKGATLRPDESANEALYGRKVANKDVIEGEIPTPESARQLVGLLTRYSARR